MAIGVAPGSAWKRLGAVSTAAQDHCGRARPLAPGCQRAALDPSENGDKVDDLMSLMKSPIRERQRRAYGAHQTLRERTDDDG